MLLRRPGIVYRDDFLFTAARFFVAISFCCWGLSEGSLKKRDRLLLSSLISAKMKCKTREKAKVDLRSLCGSSGSLWTKRPPHRIFAGF